MKRIIELLEDDKGQLSSKRFLAFAYAATAIFLAVQGQLDITIVMVSASAAHLGITAIDRLQKP